MTKLRVMVADDHAVVREGLRALINAQPDMEVVGEAGSGREAVSASGELAPDVVIMDLSMPEGGGVEATEQLKRSQPTVKVLALTIHEDENHLRETLQAGVSGYLHKRVAPSELTHAIRAIAAGGVYLDPSLTHTVVGSYLGPSNGPVPERALSEREAEVLKLIAWGHTNKEIAAKLEVSVKTVETYKTRLMEKLGFHSRVDIVRYALRQGWLKEVAGGE